MVKIETAITTNIVITIMTITVTIAVTLILLTTVTIKKSIVDTYHQVY